MEDNLMTCMGLEKWYKCSFEKLGWIVLCHAKGHNFKVLHYHHSVKELLEALKLKLGTIADQDKANDIQIMIANVEILHQYISTAMREAIQKAISEKRAEREAMGEGSPLLDRLSRRGEYGAVPFLSQLPTQGGLENQLLSRRTLGGMPSIPIMSQLGSGYGSPSNLVM